VPLIALGLALLWFGWLGDNPGNALKADGVAAQAFVNTFLAGGLAMLMWLAIEWARTGKMSMVGALTGALAGLVGVTACAGFVPTWAACLIALIAGAVCYYAVQLRAARRWDDSLDVWGVHGVAGPLGTLLVGVFAFASVDGVDGLLAGSARQLGLQAAGLAIALSYTFVVALVIYKVVDRVSGMNVSAEVERDGLDEALHGEAAYDMA
jgi:Amt family ammonium transporter